MSSQQVVDYVRLKISENQELSEIGEMLCGHCLAPDTDPYMDHLPCNGCIKPDCDNCKYLAKWNIGVDNMTVVIVAILNGRTKDNWYTWITNRVNDSYGYETPRSLPQIYSTPRLESFEARQNNPASDTLSDRSLASVEESPGVACAETDSNRR
jgi:protein phosphatase PTC2/3